MRSNELDIGYFSPTALLDIGPIILVVLEKP